MRRKLKKAALIAGSVGLMVTLAPVSAEAFTEKELRMCWYTHPAIGNFKLRAVADGPSFRAPLLYNAKCVDRNVNKGLYKITVDNARALSDAVGRADENAICGALPADADFWRVGLRADVKRNQKTYTAHRVVDDFETLFTSPTQRVESFTTNIKKDRLTRINFRLDCQAIRIGD